MFHFEKSIAIKKTPHEVFAYIANPSNMLQWRYDLIETKFQSLPIHSGDKIQEVVNFNGPKTCTVKVIELVSDRKIVFKVTSGTTYLPKRELIIEEEGGHTKFTIKVSAHSDGFSRLIEPLSSSMYSLKWDTYLFSLKKALEG
jgi:hypothetical protein